ncbi:MAG: acetylxylan esterase [Bacteroidales bacterium]|nr:acetylxylan esterase [Bacteroidales bacterium]
MKRYHTISALLLLLSLFALPLGAQRALLKQVRLTINSRDGVFAKGDTIKIYGQLTEQFSKPLTMSIYDGGTRYYGTTKESPVRTPLELTTAPRLIFTAVYQQPKAIMLSVAADEKASSMIGFMVAPEEMRPGYETPADFMAYWDNQKAGLRKSKPEVTLRKMKIADKADAKRFEAYGVEISMPEGNPVRGFLVKPRKAGKGSLPILLNVHSAGVSGAWCHATVENAVGYAKSGNGCIAIDINAHGYPEGLPSEYYVNLEQGELKDYSTRPLVDRESLYFRLMYLREVRALDYVCGLPEWDGRRVLVQGESQGGGQAEAIAGLDSRITAVVANVPALTDLGGILHNRQSGWPAPYEKEAATALGKSILPYFDGALFLQFTKAKLFMVSGMIDETCHPGGVHAAFNASTSPDKQIHPYPYRWHSGTNKPFDKEWDETIGKARRDFINDYLK